MKKMMIIVMFFLSLELSMAAGLINDMQSCQGLIKFIDNKMDSAPSKYNKDEVSKVRKGLEGYNQYIQAKIVTPGLLKFNHGDKIKANAMQKQVDAFKATVVTTYEKRYPQNRLYYDHAIALNNCAKKAVPSGQKLEDLKTALNTMVKLSKL
jgi:hypothetical protein